MSADQRCSPQSTKPLVLEMKNAESSTTQSPDTLVGDTSTEPHCLICHDVITISYFQTSLDNRFDPVMGNLITMFFQRRICRSCLIKAMVAYKQTFLIRRP